MTGFGAGEGPALGGHLRIEIRTVNHRYFNPQLRLPPELAGLEGDLREALRSRLSRGHVAVQVRWLEPPEEPRQLTVDLERARALAAAARNLKKKLRLRGDIDLAFILRQPDVLSASNGEGQVAE
ncbi:MAG: YicC/YloC family endoribonuclease, partial [Gemmatimonadales bacterium]